MTWLETGVLTWLPWYWCMLAWFMWGEWCDRDCSGRWATCGSYMDGGAFSIAYGCIPSSYCKKRTLGHPSGHLGLRVIAPGPRAPLPLLGVQRVQDAGGTWHRLALSAGPLWSPGHHVRTVPSAGSHRFRPKTTNSHELRSPHVWEFLVATCGVRPWHGVQRTLSRPVSDAEVRHGRRSRCLGCPGRAGPASRTFYPPGGPGRAVRGRRPAARGRGAPGEAPEATGWTPTLGWAIKATFAAVLDRESTENWARWTGPTR